MKKIILTLLPLVLLFIKSATAQQMNFQGKIFYAGVPFTGPAIMQFVLPDFSWSDNESVTVNNGLYSTVVGSSIPMPMNLFDSAHNSRQMIVFFNTNPIDTITLFAPFERDPNIPRYIRDSVKWNNVRNKPTVDTSFTNEIQYLSINGDTLRILSAGGLGNYVILPNLNDTFSSTTVNGNLTVIDSATSTIVSVPTGGTWTSLPSSPATGVWQSFKAPANGKLRHIRVNLSSTSSSVVFTFYNGQGSGTSSLISATAVGCPSVLGTTDLDVSSFNISVVSGSTYTFCFVPNAGGVITAQVQGNIYSGGIEGTFVPSTSSTTTNPANDLSFSIDIDNTNPSCLTFGSNCYVGIGTNNPTSQLEVKGRIKDQTGFLMPVGTIISYAGRNIPQGWLQCDGRAISRVTYGDLFDAVDTSWGHGDGSTTFNLPDLRGVFLRGIDTSAIVGASGNDIDRGSRVAAGVTNGGNTGNNVGSGQAQSVIAHNHNSFVEPISGQTFKGFYLHNGPGGTAVLYDNANIEHGFIAGGPDVGEELLNSSLANYGGSETRPINRCVYYIIKY